MKFFGALFATASLAYATQVQLDTVFDVETVSEWATDAGKKLEKSNKKIGDAVEDMVEEVQKAIEKKGGKLFEQIKKRKDLHERLVCDAATYVIDNTTVNGTPLREIAPDIDLTICDTFDATQNSIEDMFQLKAHL